MRAVDSGVWMGSEDTDLSLDDDCKIEPVDASSTGARMKRPIDEYPAHTTDSADPRVRSKTKSTPQLSHTIGLDEDDPEHRADQIIQECLDESMETVDLS